MIGKIESVDGLVHEFVSDDGDGDLYYWTAKVQANSPPEIWWTACGSTTGKLAGLRNVGTTCLRCIANRSHDGASDDP